MRSLRIRRTGSEVRASRARRFAADLAPTINCIQAGGVSTSSGIADELNRRCVLTANGKANWLPSMVWRVLARLDVKRESHTGR
jgi:hypothetical protein